MAFFPAELCERILQANVAEQCGDLEQAVRELEATASTPTLGAARVRLLRQLGRSEAATRGLNDLLQAEPPALAALLAKAEAHRAEGDGTQALATYRQILALAPGHSGARGAVWLLGGSAVSAPEPKPSAPAAISFDIEDAIAAAERAYAEGDFKLALDCFEQALGTSPDNPDLEAAIARCHRERGDTQQAEQLLSSILERHPHHFAALLGLAELQVHGGDHAAAAHWYRLAIEQQPDNVLLLSTLVWCLLTAGQPEAAAESLERALRLDPHNGQLLNAWIELCRSREELPQALEASSRLLALESASAWDRLRHVELLRQCQRPSEALACLDRFDAGDDQKLQAHGLQARGVLLRQLGQLQDSLTALREAVRLDPTCPDHAVALASLLAEIGAFQEGLEGLQESERLIGSEQGLASQPWLQFAKVVLYRGAGDSEAALAIAAGLAEDPQVGFSARVQRAELLMNLGDARAEAATLGLAPLGADQQRQALLSRSQLLKCGYRFEEAIAALEPLLASEPLDLLAADMSCLLLILAIELDAAQELFFRIRAAKQASGIDHLVETAYHGLHRCLLEEFNTNRVATDQLRSLWRLPANERLAPVAQMLNQEGDSTAIAISLLIFARQAGRLDSWSEPSPGASTAAEAVIPAQVVQYWDASDIPDGVRSLMQSWPQANPSFRHRVFDRARAAAFLERHGPPLARQALEAALSPVLQSDLLRLAVLLAEGGIYADADDRCRYSLAPLLGDGVSLVLHQEDIGSIGNNFIAAAPGHPLVAMALEMAAANLLEQQASNPWFLSGPAVLSLCFCRLYGTALSGADAAPPPGVRLVSQRQLSRRISMHLQTPVKVSDGSWWAPRGAAAGQQRLIRRQPRVIQGGWQGLAAGDAAIGLGPRNLPV